MAALRPTAMRAIAASRGSSSSSSASSVGIGAGAFRASPVARQAAKQPKFQPHLGSFQAENVLKWVPTLAMWGVGAGGAVTLFLSGVPLFQADVLKKLPLISTYFEDTTPDSDKPF